MVVVFGGVGKRDGIGRELVVVDGVWYDGGGGGGGGGRYGKGFRV